jgi:hypothetical protein
LKDTALGVLGIAFDVAVGASEAFTPLKAVLGVISAIYKNHEVRPRPFVPNTVLTNPLQETAAVREKIQHLSLRVDALETIFAEPTNDVAEQRRRDELLRYAIVPLPS